MFKKIFSVGKGLLTIGKKVDTAIDYAEKGYKNVLLFQAAIKHLKAFRADWRKIMGEENSPNVEQKPE